MQRMYSAIPLCTNRPNWGRRIVWIRKKFLQLSRGLAAATSPLTSRKSDDNTLAAAARSSISPTRSGSRHDHPDLGRDRLLLLGDVRGLDRRR